MGHVCDVSLKVKDFKWECLTVTVALTPHVSYPTSVLNAVARCNLFFLALDA